MTKVREVVITAADLLAAERAFRKNEPRDLFYRAATELVDLTLKGQPELTLAESIAILLQTWNAAYYRFRKFDEKHFRQIEKLLKRWDNKLQILRPRSLSDFSDDDEPVFKKIFLQFEKVFGPVGAAKSLHLLAPRFFPLWDREIARKYGVPLGTRGQNAGKYFAFAGIVKKQSLTLGGDEKIGRNPLKAIDEYNYCKFTKKWI